MKSLKVVQGFAKAGKIISLILYIFAIIGAIGTAVGLIIMLAFKGMVVEGEKTIEQLIEQETKQPMVCMYAEMICAIIVCVAEIPVCLMAKKYFEYELAQGTPFTFDGANKMLKLGIWILCLGLASAVACSIVYGIYVAIHGDIFPDSAFSFSGSFWLGLAFIAISYILKYGADVKQTADMAIGINNSEVIAEAQENDKKEENVQEVIVEDKNDDKDVFGK